MLTSLQKLESPAIFCISPPTSKISDSPASAKCVFPETVGFKAYENEDGVQENVVSFTCKCVVLKKTILGYRDSGVGGGEVWGVSKANLKLKIKIIFSEEFKQKLLCCRGLGIFWNKMYL